MDDQVKLSAITVTYGKRLIYLNLVLIRLVEEGVNSIIVVDNGASQETKNGLSKLKLKYKQVCIISLKENYGSAKGYNEGLKFAVNHTDCDYIFMVDDDNLPEKGALSELLHGLKNELNNNSCVLGLRINREPYVSIARGVEPSKAFPHKDSFLAFDIINILSNKIYNRRKLNSDNKYLPYAPYGGLLFNKKIIQNIGYPDKKFILYSDDHEFTHRIIQNGGRIKLISKAIIKDLEVSWNIRSRFLFDKYFKSNRNQIYFSIRNRIFFEKNYLVRRKIRFYFNMIVHISFVILFSIKNRNIKRLQLYFTAIHDGFNSDFTKNKLLKK